MLTENALRKHIRQVLKEAVNNFIESQPEITTKQLKDNSKSEVLGDPISDIEMSQMADELGSDSTSPTVSVTPGKTKGGSGPETGQKQPNFHDKTKMAK